ncbi:MAG: hypothetical protein WC174_05460, partial [Bacilli bacterium]
SLITVVIPTFNRSSCIKLFLEKCLDGYKGNLFTFEIHDSSVDNITKDLISEFQKKNKQVKINYFKYDSGINGDIKTINALKKATTDFCFLLGDGVLVDFNAMERKLIENNFDKYILISFCNDKIFKKYCDMNDDNYITDDLLEYCKHFFWNDTLYGSTIISKKIIRNIIDNNICNKYYDTTNFLYICSLFDSISLEKEKMLLCLSQKEIYSVNQFKVLSGWKRNGTTIDVYCREYYLCVEKMYNSFDSIKKYLEHEPSLMFSFKGILGLRATGSITLKKIKKNWFYIKKVIRKPYRLYLSLIFPKCFLRLIRNIYKKGK